MVELNQKKHVLSSTPYINRESYVLLIHDSEVEGELKFPLGFRIIGIFNVLVSSTE